MLIIPELVVNIRNSKLKTDYWLIILLSLNKMMFFVFLFMFFFYFYSKSHYVTEDQMHTLLLTNVHPSIAEVFSDVTFRFGFLPRNVPCHGC
jgi:hypothetical protein